MSQDDMKSDELIEMKKSQSEKALIKRKIMPIVREKIEPAIKALKQECVIVFDYHPGEDIDVYFSHNDGLLKYNTSQLIKIETHDEDSVKRKNTSRRLKPNALLQVRFPDGTVIGDRKANITFAKAITKIGLKEVQGLGLSFCKVPLVSKDLDKRYGYSQVPVDGGFYVMTHCCTNTKKKLLDKISSMLNLGLMIDII